MGSWTTVWLVLVSVGIEVTFAIHRSSLIAGHPPDVDIECTSSDIRVRLKSDSDFNGMIYPKGLSKNSTCLAEYSHAGNTITYTLPLRSCNTMSTDVNDGVEYFNTVVVQPHHKLVTSLGRGFHVRCRYQTKNKTIASRFDVSKLGTTPVVASAPLPNCFMKIFQGNPDDSVIAENARIGDHLTLTINIDHQGTYGMKVTNCIVRDGLNWSEQPLINTDGCPIDEEIMGQFEYSLNLTKASVTFPAHKFPFTSSVYYHCNVKLCLKDRGGCYDVPPICDHSGINLRRRKRDAEVQDRGSLQELRRHDEDVRYLSVEVHSGLHVNEVNDPTETEIPQAEQTRAEDDFCVSTKKFAIGIAIAGVLLMLAVILLVACIIHRRRRRKGSSTAGSSIYSGPYSNHAYSRD